MDLKTRLLFSAGLFRECRRWINQGTPDPLRDTPKIWLSWLRSSFATNKDQAWRAWTWLDQKADEEERLRGQGSAQ